MAHHTLNSATREHMLMFLNFHWLSGEKGEDALEETGETTLRFIY